MKRKTKTPVKKKLNQKQVEDGVLVYLQGGVATSDVEFGEVEVKFKDRGLFERARKSFREFDMSNIHFTQASSDQPKMTITYLFH